MIYILIEISNYPQLLKLQKKLILELEDQLESFALNRGGALNKKWSGFFLFSFNPERDRAMVMVSDFIFLCYESLHKRAADLHGFTLLLEDFGNQEEETVFAQMKSMLFLTPEQNKIWSGNAIIKHPDFSFLKSQESDGLTEISGPVQELGDTSQILRQYLGLTGWVDALGRNLQSLGEESRPGKILRITLDQPLDKIPFLMEALKNLNMESLPLLGSLTCSLDPWAQLGGLLNRDVLDRLPQLLSFKSLEVWKNHPHWKVIAENRGIGNLAGDHFADDFRGLLFYYFQALIEDLKARRLPPIFVVIQPEAFESKARALLEEVLTPFLRERQISLALLEEDGLEIEFLSQWPGVTWTLPTLSSSRVEKEVLRFPGAPSPSSWEKVIRGSRGRGMGVVHSLSLSNPWVDGSDPSWALLMELETTHRKIYFMSLLGLELLNPEWIIQFFAFLGEDAGVVEDKLVRLIDLGYLSFEQRPRILRPDFREALESLFSQEADFLKSRLALFLYEKYQSIPGLYAEPVFSLLMEAGEWGKALDVLKVHANQKINRGQGDVLPRLSLRMLLEKFSVPPEWRYRFLLHSAAFKMRFSLDYALRKLTPSHLKVFQKKFPEGGPEEECGEWLLQSGRFLFQTGQIDEGFLLMRKAFIHAQAHQDLDLEMRSGNEIGYALLYKRRIDEGREYFEMTSRTAQKFHYTYVHILSSLGQIMSLFLWGNFSGALDMILNLEAVGASSSMQGAQVFLQFLKGRIQFVLGDYSSAVESFRKGQVIAQEFTMAEALLMLQGWEARGLAYWGEPDKALKILEAGTSTSERTFFASEAHFFNKNPEKAFDLLSYLKDTLPLEPLSGEVFRWSTGFGMVEDRVHPIDGKSTLLEILIHGFRAYLKGKLGRMEEGMADLHPWTSRKGLFEGNPHSHLFHYWQYSLMSKEDRTLEAQRITILGRGLKDLQTRASRILDRNKRNDYLQIPYWNRLYMDEAKKNKLV